jgi:hypothetical protein
MDFAERKKWEQVKKALEAAGKTNSPYYAQAIAFLRQAQSAGSLPERH